MSKFCVSLVLVLVLLLAGSAVSQGNRGYQCGKRKQQVTGLITNGSNTKLGEWPWHGGLFRRKNAFSKEYICGATLVHQNYVITASHCVVDRESGYTMNAAYLTVDFGHVRLLSSSSHGQTHTVQEITVHPEFEKDSNRHDVALLTLKMVVKFSEYVVPICLDIRKSDTRIHDIVGQEGVVVGWGRTEIDETSVDLKLAKLPIVDYPECLETNKDLFSKLIYPGMFCAGSKDGTNVCNGDSGGGLYINDGNRWFLRGVVSFSSTREDGSNKCDVNHFAGFMNVQYYVSWIREQVPDLSSDLLRPEPTTTPEPTDAPELPIEYPIRIDECDLNPCGTDADCRLNNLGRRVCSCPAGYFGNPQVSCQSRPTQSNPCSRACGENANCMVRNNVAVCTCPQNMEGDPLVRCRPTFQGSSFQGGSFQGNNNCSPNPCGTGANCHINNRGVPTCSCPLGYQGNPLTACRRGECLDNAECRSNQLCHMGNCINPCVGACGENAQCRVRDHVAVCSCPQGTQGNPFERCSSGFSQSNFSFRRETYFESGLK